MELFISIASFVIILGLLIFLRSRGSSLEIKLPDIIVAILPVMIFLIVSGKLSKFELSESGLKIETAITEAAQSKISGLEIAVELEKLPTETVSSATKGGTAEIPKLINQKTEALSFYLGYSGYNGHAIGEYLTRLTAKPFLKYLIFLDENGKFFGISPAAKFANQDPSSEEHYYDLAKWLVNNDTKSLTASVPGLITRDEALSQSNSRSQALSKMMELKVDTLPVLDNEGNLAGMVDRSSVWESPRFSYLPADGIPGAVFLYPIEGYLASGQNYVYFSRNWRGIQSIVDRGVNVVANQFELQHPGVAEKTSRRYHDQFEVRHDQ